MQDYKPIFIHEYERAQEEERRNMLKTLLAKKFGSLSSDILARLEAADADRLSEWLENIFTLTLDDLQAA